MQASMFKLHFVPDGDYYTVEAVADTALSLSSAPLPPPCSSSPVRRDLNILAQEWTFVQWSAEEEVFWIDANRLPDFVKRARKIGAPVLVN